MKRKHQIETETVIDGIIGGSSIRQMLVDCTPGGGKSTIPIEACRLITAGLAEAFCWIVPRSSLQRQGELAFADPYFKKLFNHDYTARAATNEIHPCRGTNGFITTYQALGVDFNKTALHEFSRRKYILILDEFHHCEKGGLWEKAIAPLVERASFVIFMTGTLERNTGKPIAFIPYKRTGYGYAPVVAETPEQAVIRYTRTDALKEKAILPLQFTCHDGAVKWKTDTGIELSYEELSSVPDQYATMAIYTAVDTKYAEELTDEGLRHWRKHKKEVNPRAKVLLVTANIKHARAAVDLLKRHGLKSAIATSHDSKAAHRNIELFRGPKLDTLVSIAMAYEGFDVKPLTHIISLTHIRSKPWIEQMVARAVRVDPHAGPYRTQKGFIFCPDDPRMRSLIARFRAEELAVIDSLDIVAPTDKQPEQKPLFDDTQNLTMRAPGNITPLESRLAGHRMDFIGVDFAYEPGYATYQIVTESQREKNLRNQIDRHVKDYARINRYNPKEINIKLKDCFGKPREEMTRPELERLMGYLQKNYRLEVHRGQSSEAISTRAVML